MDRTESNGAFEGRAHNNSLGEMLWKWFVAWNEKVRCGSLPFVPRIGNIYARETIGASH